MSMKIEGKQVHEDGSVTIDLEFEASCFATECPFCKSAISVGAIHLCGKPSNVVLHPSILIEMAKGIFPARVTSPKFNCTYLGF